ncbi:MAG: glycosyltransferase family 4 protein [Candidatus Omnitrophota bacterium]
MKKSFLLITEETIPPVQRFSLTERLAEVLSEIPDVKVHLVAVGANQKPGTGKVYFHGITIRNWSLFNLIKRAEANLKLLASAIWTVRKYRVSFIHGWWPIAFLTAKLTGRPYAVDMPEFIEEMYRSFNQPFYKIVRLILRRFQLTVATGSRLVIVESQLAADEWHRRKKTLDATRIQVIPYGVDTEFFLKGEGQSIRQRFGLSKDEIIVVYHGDIGYDDGVDVLLEAAKDLPLIVAIVGEGPRSLMNRLRKMAGPGTIFTGWLPYLQMPSVLSAADICCAPFRSTRYTNTTFPLKIMESMAAGRATVCSRITALASVVKDRQEVFLVKPGDVTALRGALLELAHDSQLRQKISQAGQARAFAIFDWRLRTSKETAILINLANPSAGIRWEKR